MSAEPSKSVDMSDTYKPLLAYVSATRYSHQRVVGVMVLLPVYAHDSLSPAQALTKLYQGLEIPKT